MLVKDFIFPYKCKFLPVSRICKNNTGSQALIFICEAEFVFYNGNKMLKESKLARPGHEWVLGENDVSKFLHR